MYETIKTIAGLLKKNAFMVVLLCSVLVPEILWATDKPNIVYILVPDRLRYGFQSGDISEVQRRMASASFFRPCFSMAFAACLYMVKVYS